MSWRPEGWEKIKRHYRDLPPEAYEGTDPYGDIFELGATAMLEALFKLAEESPTGTFTFDSEVVHALIVKEL